MDSEGSVTHLLRRLKSGDDAALGKIFERYYARVVGLARRKLGAMRRMADEDDVAQSAFWGFYRSLKENRLPNLNNRQDLISLLIVITARQAATQVEREMAKKRGGGKLQGESAYTILARSGESGAGANESPDTGPLPDEQAMLAECYEHYVGALPEDLRPVAEDYLAGWTHSEIAARNGCSTRTVDRWVHSICDTWRDLATKEANK